jgi:iron-sulfur cluster assembly 2
MSVIATSTWAAGPSSTRQLLFLSVVSRRNLRFRSMIMVRKNPPPALRMQQQYAPLSSFGCPPQLGTAYIWNNNNTGRSSWTVGSGTDVVPAPRHRSMVIVTQTNPKDLSVDESVKVTATAAAASPHNTAAGNQPSPLHITRSCWERVHQLASKRGNDDAGNVYLRIFVDSGGCSGFTYKFELDTNDNLEPDDIIYYENGINSTTDSSAAAGAEARVVVDPGSLDQIAGSTVDYVQEMIKNSFEIKDNPQSESACGCGSSFALKNFSKNPALD